MKNLTLLLMLSLTALQSFAQYSAMYPDTVNLDTITFEEPYEYIQIDTSSQNLWQIGEPGKIFFDRSYSLKNAIVTDTLNTYPINNISHFDLKIGQFNTECYPYCLFIEIKHKYDTDTLKDGGFITVSYDEGLTWTNIINDSIGDYDVTPGINWYPGREGSKFLYTNSDTLFNGEPGFSGNSKDWVTTSFAWFFLPVSNIFQFIGDTILIRFNFISDKIENKREGWMIDNIRLFYVDFGGGTNEPKPLDVSISPNPFSETAFVQLDDYRELTLGIYNIQGQLVSNKKYFDNQAIIINRDKLNSGVYFVKIKTKKNIIAIKKLIVR